MSDSNNEFDKSPVLISKLCRNKNSVFAALITFLISFVPFKYFFCRSSNQKKHETILY